MIMPQSLDPAIVNAITEAFSMSPEQCDIKPSGGAGFSTSSKITAFINGETKYLFLKTGSEADMFKGVNPSQVCKSMRTLTPACRRACFPGRSVFRRSFYMSNEPRSWQIGEFVGLVSIDRVP